MRRVLARACVALLVCAAAALLPATPAGAYTATAKVVGGTAVADGTVVPYQALVLPGPYLCGGSILDATHVVTAAHCVFDDDAGTVIGPADVDVYAGVTHLSSLGGGQHPVVTTVTIEPDYDPAVYTNDAAILTLAAPGLTFSATVAPIGLVDAGTATPIGTDLTVSGWGTTLQRSPYSGDNTDASSDTLLEATIPAASGCTVYESYDPSVQLCAGTAGKDACQGDSGGPLAQQIGGVARLAGIVSAGAGCAWPGVPGLYTRVANASINAFLAARGAGAPDAMAPPTIVTPPTLSGTAEVGGVLSCTPGQWSHGTVAVHVSDATSDLVLSTGASLTVRASDAGRTVRCEATARSLGGSASAYSDPVAIPVPVAPAPITDANPPSPPLLDPAPTRDTVAPTTKVLSAVCTHTMCLLTIDAHDATPGTGIAAVEASVRTAYRTTCRVNGKRRACTRTESKRLTATHMAGTSYRIKTPRLRAGTQTFTFSARDVAGNRQAPGTKLVRRLR